MTNDATQVATDLPVELTRTGTDLMTRMGNLIDVAFGKGYLAGMEDFGKVFLEALKSRPDTVWTHKTLEGLVEQCQKAIETASAAK